MLWQCGLGVQIDEACDNLGRVWGQYRPIYSGTRIVGTLSVSSDIGAVEISEFTVVSGVGMEVAAPTLTVSELMVALVVATLLAVLVWLGG